MNCKKILFGLFILAVVLSSFISDNVYAQDNNLRGLTITPLRKELFIQPGTSKTGIIELSNNSSQTTVIDLSAEEFNVINQQYDYVFTAESDVAKWIKYDDDKIILDSNQKKTVQYTVGVPLLTEPGGRYLSIFASVKNNNEGDFGYTQRVASLLYITVEGDYSRDGNLLKLNSPWLIFDKSKWSAVIQNTGSTHFISRYQVKISSIFSKKTYSDLNSESLIMPSSVRSIVDDITLPRSVGIYKLDFLIGIGDKPAANVVRYFLYIPKYFLLIFIIIITLVVSIYFAKKKSN